MNHDASGTAKMCADLRDCRRTGKGVTTPVFLIYVGIHVTRGGIESDRAKNHDYIFFNRRQIGNSSGFAIRTNRITLTSSFFIGY